MNLIWFDGWLIGIFRLCPLDIYVERSMIDQLNDSKTPAHLVPQIYAVCLWQECSSLSREAGGKAPACCVDYVTSCLDYIIYDGRVYNYIVTTY